MWMIIGGGAALVGFLVWNSRRPKKFSYRGKSYARHADGSYTYADGGFIATSELDEVRDHWDSSHDSSSSDSSDGGSDGGGGDGGGGGGD
jgi:hypothetical protein